MNSIDEQFFSTNIPNAYKMRKLHEMEKKQRKLELSSYMYKLITQSNQISKSNSLIHSTILFRSKGKSAKHVKAWREEKKEREECT